MAAHRADVNLRALATAPPDLFILQIINGGQSNNTWKTDPLRVLWAQGLREIRPAPTLLPLFHHSIALYASSGPDSGRIPIAFAACHTARDMQQFCRNCNSDALDQALDQHHWTWNLALFHSTRDFKYLLTWLGSGTLQRSRHGWRRTYHAFPQQLAGGWLAV